MSQTLRHMVSILCLVAFICGGQWNACACDVAPDHPCTEHSSSSPDGASHHHDDSHDSSGCGDHSQCVCTGCHTCNHLPMVLSAAELPVLQPRATPQPSADSPRTLMQCAEIFIPPKLA